MKKLIFTLFFALLTVCSFGQSVAERLNRAPVAVKASNGILVSWRSLKSDADGMTFNVYRDGTKIASVSDKTNYLDAAGQAGNIYTIEAVVGGSAVETVTATAWNNMFKSLKVKRPAAAKNALGSGSAAYYLPDDASVGDVDGDGEYELILKWMPSNQQDNGSNGVTSACIIDCYKLNLDGNQDTEQLWRVNLGPNIRSGNHYTQFLVYDFDGDGKAEMICKTAPGSTDGSGNYVSAAASDDAIKSVNNTKTYVNSNGHTTGGEEFLTVFNGETGAAMHTVWYNPARSAKPFATGATSYGGWESVINKSSNYNRGERYNAAVAYLDGTDKLPSAIMQRGYYTYTFLWAVDWNGTELKTRWLHAGTAKSQWNVYDGDGNETGLGTGKSSFGQGVHGISVGDVDGDGCDEIVIGAATIDNDGWLLCSTGKGHGDAIHLADLCPDLPGLEVMMPHEESPYGYDVHNAETGAFLVSETSSGDNGRGLAADFIPSHKGSEFWSSADGNIRACEDGTVLASSKPDTNFRIYWTGDPFDQTFDGRYDSSTKKCSPRIRAWNTSSKKITDVVGFASHGAPQTCNTTKATPCLQADILGDWREEIIMYQYEEDPNAEEMTLMIFSTPESTSYKVPCLMQDHTYRMGIAWQNASYNQPPHLGYSLAESLGINRATYTTNVTSHAPKYTEEGDDTPPVTDPSAEFTEYINSGNYPSEDKGVFSGVSFTAGQNGEFTASTKGEYVKTRTGNNNEIVFAVNEGYAITAIEVEGYSNNTSSKADRSIDLTGIYVDGSGNSVLASTVTFPGGTAGQTPKTAKADGFNATQKLVLTFDNSKIVDSTTDSAGKNKQIFAIFMFTYHKATATGINEIVTVSHDNVMYNLAGQRVQNPVKGQIYIMNGKKFRK